MIMINIKKENKICKLYKIKLVFILHKRIFSYVKNTNNLNFFMDTLLKYYNMMIPCCLSV